MPPGLMRPMRPGGIPRGGIWNCLCPRRPNAPLTEPAVGRELEPYAQLHQRDWERHYGQGQHTSLSCFSTSESIQRGDTGDMMYKKSVTEIREQRKGRMVTERERERES